MERTDTVEVPPLTREDLAQIRCSNPACEGQGECALEVSPACHPGSPVFAAYFAVRGVMEMKCALCHRPLRAVLVGTAEFHRPGVVC